MAESMPLQMELVTPVGKQLLFKSMRGHEEMSRLFEYQIVALSDKQTIVADDLLGKPVAVSVNADGDSKRWFNGICASFGIDGVVGRYFSYRITMRPWMWLLTRSANLRIFQQKTAPDIVKEVLGTYGGTLVDEIQGSYVKREYCVQYRETDFNFVSRLLEEEGIFYYFRHGDGKHELVLASKPTTHVVAPGYAKIVYLEDDGGTSEQRAINDWHMRHEIQTGKFTLSDYNFKQPATDLKSDTSASSRSHGHATYEVYDYPGLYDNKAAGDDRAAVRRAEAESRFGRFSGKGNTPGLVVGAKFTLDNHPRTDQNVDYIVLATEVQVQQAGYEGMASGDDTGFLCSFVAQQHAEPFRPERSTRKPAVGGPQTAVVSGTAEGDINVDEFSRVKVHFHWDREGKKDGNDTCWVRVASAWAGAGWGMISLPRVGQEVVVDFLEGDPDQPLITGRVYNAKQLPPYALPDNATVSTVKSRSLKGAAADFNEMRFEDKAGSEYVLLHAQKDRIEFVEETLTSDIGKHEHRTVKENRKEHIKGEYHLTVDKDVKQKLGQALNVTTGKDMLFKSGATWGLKAAQDITADSGTAISLKSGTAMHLKVGTNLGADAGQNVHIKGGVNVVLEAGVQISIKAGASSIVLGPDGVSITGAMVKINSGGSPGSGSGASPVAPTAPAEPEAPDAAVDPLKDAHR